MGTKQTKFCAMCKQPFNPTGRNQKYCPICREIAERKAHAKARRAYEARKREEQRATATWY